MNKNEIVKPEVESMLKSTFLKMTRVDIIKFLVASSESYYVWIDDDNLFVVSATFREQVVIVSKVNDNVRVSLYDVNSIREINMYYEIKDHSFLTYHDLMKFGVDYSLSPVASYIDCNIKSGKLNYTGVNFSYSLFSINTYNNATWELV